MKIAIPTKNNTVDNHFGHCSHFTIYETDGTKVTNQYTMDSPQGCGCKSNLTELLIENGVSIMLAGNMGEGAVNKLKVANINVIRGCSGNTNEVVQSYLNNQLKDSGYVCATHGHDHTCNH